MSDEEILQHIYGMSKELYNVRADIAVIRKEMHELVEMIKKGGK